MILKFKCYIHTSHKTKYCLSFYDTNNKQFNLNLQIDHTTLNKLKILKSNKEYNINFNKRTKNITSIKEILGVT